MQNSTNNDFRLGVLAPNARHIRSAPRINIPVIAVWESHALNFAVRHPLYLRPRPLLVPSVTAPTVADLYGQPWASVEIVVEEHQVRELMPRLVKAGAEGIIEFPLNKFL